MQDDFEQSNSAAPIQDDEKLKDQIFLRLQTLTKKLEIKTHQDDIFSKLLI